MNSSIQTVQNMRGLDILSVGDGVAQGVYRRHSRFRRVVNFYRGNRIISLVSPEIGHGPASIVNRNLDYAGADSGTGLMLMIAMREEGGILPDL